MNIEPVYVDHKGAAFLWSSRATLFVSDPAGGPTVGQ